MISTVLQRFFNGPGPQAYPDRFKLVLVVGDSPHDIPDGWADTDTGTRDQGSTYEVVRETGWIDEKIFARHSFPAANDTAVFVCGPPAMYESFCGPRDSEEVGHGTILHELGYCSTSVIKF